MGTMYSKEFKIAAVKRVDETGRSVAAVAAELGINENTLHGWRKKYREDPQHGVHPWGAPHVGDGSFGLRKQKSRN